MDVLAKFSKLESWAAELYTANLSCGAFLMLSGRGRGRLAQQGMILMQLLIMIVRAS